MPARKKRPRAVARRDKSRRKASPPRRKIGLLEGQIWIAPDFDETSEEIIRAFEGAFEDELPRA